MSYVILTDAACDLDRCMCSETGFAVVPMEYLQGSEYFISKAGKYAMIGSVRPAGFTNADFEKDGY